MASPSAPAHEYSHAGPSRADYTSMMLQMYFETLERSATAQVLDIGPVCEENITYFARRVKRFHVCDMFLRLNRTRRKSLPPRKLWEHLDYAPHTFEGINLWDFIDYLNEGEIGRLVDRCHTLLKPRAMMIVTSFEAQPASSQINSFVIKEDCRVTFRLQKHLDLPRNYRSNRIITEMLSEFFSVKSFLYRNGVREFLCRHN